MRIASFKTDSESGVITVVYHFLFLETSRGWQDFRQGGGSPADAAPVGRADGPTTVCDVSVG